MNTYTRFIETLQRLIPEEFLLDLLGISAAIGFPMLLIMFFYSVLRIEREMKRDGLKRPFKWDIVMTRIPLYWALLSDTPEGLAKRAQEHADFDSFFDLRVKDVAPYIRPIDRYIAKVANFAALIAFICVCLLTIIYR